MDATPTYIECATGKWSLARELTKSFLLVYRYHSSAMTTTSTLWTKFWTYGTSTCYVWISASAWLTHVYAWHHARDKMLSPSLLQESLGTKLIVSQVKPYLEHQRCILPGMPPVNETIHICVEPVHQIRTWGTVNTEQWFNSNIMTKEFISNKAGMEA